MQTPRREIFAGTFFIINL